MTKILSIACSTLGDRLSGAIEVYHSLKLQDESVDFIIIHQIPAGSELSEESQKLQQWLVEHSKINYVPMYTKGLTKSRNVGIKSCQTKYIWIMDDDITFSSGILPKVETYLLQSSNAACHTFESKKPSGKKRTLYPRDGKILNKKELLRVASFEMILNKDFLVKEGVGFREDMGVGGNKINLGEESVLISDLGRRDGATVHHALEVLSHPEISTGVIVSLENFYSKGVVIRRCFDGFERIYFYIRDANRLLRNKKNEFGVLPHRIRLIVALTKGCFFNG